MTNYDRANLLHAKFTKRGDRERMTKAIMAKEFSYLLATYGSVEIVNFPQHVEMSVPDPIQEVDKDGKVRRVGVFG